jgi:hypothetical protein
MAPAPFRVSLTLVILDGDFDLPQNLFAGLADRRAQGGGGGAGEVHDGVVGEVGVEREIHVGGGIVEREQGDLPLFCPVHRRGADGRFLCHGNSSLD